MSVPVDAGRHLGGHGAADRSARARQGSIAVKRSSGIVNVSVAPPLNGPTAARLDRVLDDVVAQGNRFVAVELPDKPGAAPMVLSVLLAAGDRVFERRGCLTVVVPDGRWLHPAQRMPANGAGAAQIVDLRLKE